MFRMMLETLTIMLSHHKTMIIKMSKIWKMKVKMEKKKRLKKTCHLIMTVRKIRLKINKRNRRKKRNNKLVLLFMICPSIKNNLQLKFPS